MRKSLFLFVGLAVVLAVMPAPGLAEGYVTDLKAYSITVYPASPAVNQDCKVVIKIMNQGEAALTTSTGLSSYDYNFENFRTTNINYTSPNYSNMVVTNDFVTYTIEGEFTRDGSKSLYFKVDAANELRETKITEEGYEVFTDDNNELTKNITVVPEDSYDVETTDINYSMDDIVMNKEMDIRFRVKNTGEASLTDDKYFEFDNVKFDNAQFSIEDRAKTDSTINIDDPWGPGEVYDFTYTGRFVGYGDQDLGFTFDSRNLLDETKEANNATTTTAYVHINQSDADDFGFTGFDAFLVSSTSIRVIWTTSEDTTGQALYTQPGWVSEYSVDSENSKKEHRATLENLDPDTGYLVWARATRGETTKDTDRKTLKTPRDNSLTFTSAPAVAADNDTLIFSWSTDVLSTGALNYRKKGAEEWTTYEPGGQSYSLSHRFTKAGFDMDAEYEYYATAKTMYKKAYDSSQGTFRVSTVEEGGSGADAGDSGETVGSQEQEQDQGPSRTQSRIEIRNQGLYNNLRGKIVLQVEANGEAYYIHPGTREMYFLGRPDDAFSVMREQGVGITTANLERIPIGLAPLTGPDTDGDGLSDLFEDAIGTDKTKADTDGDGFNDKEEAAQSYNPNGQGNMGISTSFASGQKGKIFLQVEGAGEAWYVSPTDGKRYFLGRPADAFSVMRSLGLGISNSNFDSLK